MINLYELVFITKDEKDETVQKIREQISSLGGVIDKEENWGVKKFSYRIKEHNEGAYFIWTIKMPQSALPDFKKKLNFEVKIIRYNVQKH